MMYLAMVSTHLKPQLRCDAFRKFLIGYNAAHAVNICEEDTKQ